MEMIISSRRSLLYVIYIIMTGWMKCPSGWMTGRIQGMLLSSFTICNVGVDLVHKSIIYHRRQTSLHESRLKKVKVKLLGSRGSRR
jgi:hypothetical protein